MSSPRRPFRRGRMAAALALSSGAALVAVAAHAQLPGALVPPPPAATPATPAPPSPAPSTPAPAAPPAPVPAPVPAPAPPPAAPAAPPPITSPAAPPPVAVEAAPLQAPDLFAADAGRPTGLPPDLWKGASLALARTVIPLAAVKPMTPAAQAFALRLMSTSASAPEGGGSDADLAAARINVVLSLGDPMGARAMLERTPGVRQSAALSQAAAEADLVLGREDEACSLGDNLAVGKDGPYFRRLRAYCLLRAGDKPGAQLAYDLTAEQAKDEVYKRLMGAAVSGAAAGQQPSLRNGLEYALSRRMGLDLTPAMDKAWAPIATVVARDPTAPAQTQAAAAAQIARREADMSRAASLNPAVAAAAQSVAGPGPLDPQLAERLATAGASGSQEAQQALALYAAAGAPGSAAVRAAFAAFDIGPARASQAKLLELDAVSAAGAKGDSALLALWAMIDAGEAGPLPADRARIVRAINRAGFTEDARRYALEGLLGLRTPPPPPPAPPPAVKKPPAKTPAHRPARKRRSGD